MNKNIKKCKFFLCGLGGLCEKSIFGCGPAALCRKGELYKKPTFFAKIRNWKKLRG
jgi:hypothetical protein